jgi:chemotaxis protein MotB
MYKSGGHMKHEYRLWIIGAMVAFTGCVSTSEFRKSQAETQACLRDKQALSGQVDALTNEKAQLAQAAQAKETELTQVKGTYDELIGNLKNEISSGQIQVTELKGKLTLNMVEKILFNSGQANVKDTGKKVLDSIAAALKNIQDKDIRVEGYTDNIAMSPKLKDRFPTNWELSTARATNVVRYLVETDGLDPSRLIAAGFGEYHPMVSNDTEEGRAQNRRIDIVLVPHEVSGNAAFSHAVAKSSVTISGPEERIEGSSELVPGSTSPVAPAQ